MRRIRAGIVGLGSIGTIHLETVRRLGWADVAAVCVRGRGQSHEGALRDLYGVPSVYADYRDLVADPAVDAVHVCTPNDSHFEIAAAALAAGKHVLSEKPLARNADEAARLASLADEAEISSGAKAAVNFPYRHHAMAQVARRMIEEGALGDLHSVRGAYLQDWLLSGDAENWRLDPAKAGKSRAMADIGSHWLDLARFLTGREVLEVCADVGEYVRRPRRPGTEDGGSVLLGFSGGLRGSFSISQASAGRKMSFWIEIDGSEASLRWDHENPYRLWIGHGGKANEELIYHPSMAPAVAWEAAGPELAPQETQGEEPRGRLAQAWPRGKPERWPDPQKRMIEAFYRSILDPPAKEEAAYACATFKDGARTALVVDAILESHEGRRWVAVPPL